MSVITTPAGSARRTAEVLVSIRDDLRRRWVDATPRTRSLVQMGVFAGAVLAAYNYTLITLLQNVGLETPLAYVSLVPLIAVFLAGVKRAPARPEPEIYDRQLDYIVGLPLIGAALAMNLVLPRQLSVMYWVWRIDLLSMPLFVAGVVAIIFGVRVLWRQKLAVAFLLLAWPTPYQWFLLGVLSWFTNITVDTLLHLVSVVHIASPIPGSGGLFNVVHRGISFPLSVVSACSGVNSVVGFLLIGASFIAVVHGPWWRKLPWLAGGMLVIWSMNIIRLMFIFWAGGNWGEHVAISILHPFVGLVTFSVGVVFMISLIRPLGLTIGSDYGSRSGTSHRAPAARRLAVPRVNAAFALVAVAGLVLGIVDSNLKVYNLVANSAGEPTLSTFDLTGSDAPAGFIRSYETDYTWATPYFGDNSTWNRYTFTDELAFVKGSASSRYSLASNESVFEDVIDTTDLNSFSAYGIEACYEFHGYTLRDVSDVNLGGGITGQTLAYQTPSNGAWSIVYWIVPVSEHKATHYERIVLYLQNTPNSKVRSPKSISGLRNLSGSLANLGPAGQVLIANRQFLVGFARQLIANQADLGVSRTKSA